MEEVRPRRVLIEDRRHTGAYLRATWHPERRVVVISHWHGDVCAASTTLSLADLPKLISLLVSALSDATTRRLRRRSQAG